MFIEFMMRHQLVTDVEMLQEDTRSTGVLCQHKVYLFQDTDGTKGHVLHIAYWGWYNVQNTHNRGQSYKIEVKSER